MPDDPSEFDDEGDPVGNSGAPLPPDDRLWRHPSELGAGLARRQAALVAAAPSRPGSLSAALAGALLAAGIVLVATHFAATLGRGASANSAGGTSLNKTLDTVTASTVKNALSLGLATNSGTGISPSLEALVNRVDASTVLVQATRGSAVIQVTGIVVGATCLVIAPASIVEADESIDMTLPGGKLVEAQVVGVDRATGIAVLRCDESGLAAVRDDDEPASADEFVALVGASRQPTIPYMGIVMSIDQPVVLDGTRLMDELETDVPSAEDGEAVVGGDGDVLGVVVGESNGVSIATPMWLALAVTQQIVASGKPGHAWLGIAGGSVTSNDQPAGVRVMAVASGSAAARAGIRAGDVIDSVDGRRTDSLTTLEAQLYCLRPGSVASIGVVRGGRDLVEKATLAAAPAA